ncbi:hypothetical protein QN362_00505 [Actimicrobium sp. CCC2.4]|uniref:hypothetical protein n=1 Tax=Actimicrobium sp. CCC2.4 TaxID=3048606 RepID=UPI002AC8F9DF|nr:hypothetical protein [Actimicrobium sp. CCC2.4]MEB0133806.1 hypothetical protein [Actimicrobium sp. CCC2.4]WPX31349.1 hypothetical protein RHM62_13985 [Actimicrobium sp. CCC2.4]
MTSPDGNGQYIGFVSRIADHPNFAPPNRVYFTENESSQPSQSDDSMNAPTREEFNSKLETMEVKMDGRVTSIEAKIDGFMGRLEEKFGRMDDRMTRIESDLSSTRSDFKSLKTTIVITAIASVIGLFAANVTMVQTMLASFESGRNVSSAQAGIVSAQSDIKRQTEETSALLKQLQKDHPSAPSRP